MDRISTDDMRPRRQNSSKRSKSKKHENYYQPNQSALKRKKKNRPIMPAAASPKFSAAGGTTIGARKKKGRYETQKSNKNDVAFGHIFNKISDIWREMKSVFVNKRLAFDKPLLIIVLILLVVGLIMMYSASYAYAYYELKDSTYYIRRQILFAIAGIIAMFAVSTVPPERFKGKFTWGVLGISYVLLVIVLFLPRIQGVRRWINLGFTTFQPSEIAKFAAILWCSYYITENYREMNVASYPDKATKLKANRSKFTKWRYSMWQNFKVAVLPFLIFLGPMLALIVIEPHLSCTILVVLIIGTQMYVGGTKKSYFGALGILAVIAGYMVIYTDIVPYGKTRIDVWKDPFIDKLGDGWQNIQSLYAISSGGLFGVGLGNSRQKYLYISEPQNDFIFAVICEELGLVGAMFIILLFVLFVWRGFAVSLANPDKFSKFVGIGITSQIGFQTLLNVCVVTKIVPNTGISLPFFSSGGTSLMMLLMEIGILLAISRRSPNKII